MKYFDVATSPPNPLSGRGGVSYHSMDHGDGVFDSFSPSSQWKGLVALDELEVLLGEGGEHGDRRGADVFALGDGGSLLHGCEVGEHVTLRREGAKAVLHVFGGC